jgi:hypothetical protein
VDIESRIPIVIVSMVQPSTNRRCSPILIDILERQTR